MIDLQQAEDGYRCAHCDGFVKVYKRSITGRMARVLVLLSRQTDAWTHIPTLQRRFGLGEKHFAMLAYWGLIEQKQADRGDGSMANGWWRATHDGMLFVAGRLRVCKTLRVLHGKVLGDAGKGTVSIQDVADATFSYAELMAA